MWIGSQGFSLEKNKANARAISEGRHSSLNDNQENIEVNNIKLPIEEVFQQKLPSITQLLCSAATQEHLISANIEDESVILRKRMFSHSTMTDT